MMDKEVFCVFHAVYSKDAKIPLFSLKVLSRIIGYSLVNFNAHKVVLLERTVAIKIFGYAPGFNTARSGYFLCYSSYILADGTTNLKTIEGYSRNKFLRYRGDFPDQHKAKRIKH